MQVNEAVKLIISGEDLSFAQIKEAYDALSGKFSDTAEFGRLRIMAKNKIKTIDNSLFGMSLDEAIAAAAVVKDFTPKADHATEDFEKFLGKIEDRIAELKQQEAEAEQNTTETENAETEAEATQSENADEISAQLINRNYEHISKIFDKINPLDENDAFFAESRTALEMIDARDDNNQPADINPYLVEQARIKTMADLLTSKEKISEEVFRQHFKNNIDINTFTVLNADKAAEFVKNGDTKGMTAAFSSMVNDFTAGGKKQKQRVDYNTAIALLNLGNDKITAFTNKMEQKFGNIPAVKDLRTHLNKLDAKLTKKYGKAYTTSRDIVKGISGVATDLALVGLAGATGPIGLGIYSVYTFNRNVSPYLQAYGKAHNKTGIGFWDFARQNKRDASLAGLYTVSSMLTGFSAAGLAYHNLAHSAGSNTIDTLTRYISNSKMGIGLASIMTKQGVDVINAVKHGKNVKEAVGKFALAAGIFAVAAGGREMYNLEHSNGDLTHAANGVDANHGTGTGSIIINGDNNEVTILNDHSVDNSTHIDNSVHTDKSTHTTIIDNCCDPCPDCEPVDVPPSEPHKPEPAKQSSTMPEAQLLELDDEDMQDPTMRYAIKVERLAEPEIKGVDAPEPLRPNLPQAEPQPVETRAAAPVTEGKEVLYNGVHHYDDVKEAMNTHAQEGAVQKDDGRFYDQHKSSSAELDTLNQELKDYVAKINACPEDQPVDTKGVSDGVRNFDNIKQLIQSREGR